jgi:spoIIIJ-associated protein
MLSLMGVEAQVLANVSEEEGIRLRIDSSGMGVIIGHRGETLDAIQYLTSLHVNRARKERGYTRVTIDTEGYREEGKKRLQGWQERWPLRRGAPAGRARLSP